jgi:hypothetical protein
LARRWTTPGNTSTCPTTAGGHGTLLLKCAGYIHASWNKKLLLLLWLLLRLRRLLLRGGNNCL